jgi:hypothetical protein
LLTNLHARGYDRIILVGHSLGSILAYDLISYFWAQHEDARIVTEGTAEFAALKKLEAARARESWPDAQAVKAYLEAQTEFGHLLRCRPKPVGNNADTRWLITDFITLGSPLSHAEFLMANSKTDLERRRKDREYPTNPPLRERLDTGAIEKAEAAGFAKGTTELFAFPFGNRQWELHHAAPFAAVRWTNIHDPARLVAFGDLISGPVAPVFGDAVIDVNLKKLRGQALHFTHTDYWKLPCDPNMQPPPARIDELRKALDLGGRFRPL